MLKKNILIIGAILLVIVLLGLIAFFVPSKNPSSLLPSPTPYVNKEDAIPGQEGPQGATSEELKKRYAAIASMIEKLPYNGKNFSLYYTFQNDTFVLYINPTAKTEGNDELDAFLKQNGILSRSWIEKFFVTYISPTPTGARITPTLTPAP